ncbi:hypothetical protein D3C87_1783440 [compost metagenome]
MIATLPANAVVVVPTTDLAKEVEKRISLERPLVSRTIRVIAVRDHDDLQRMQGISAPVFFDHSFSLLNEVDVIKAAYEAAIVCSRMFDWNRH